MIRNLQTSLHKRILKNYPSGLLFCGCLLKSADLDLQLAAIQHGIGQIKQWGSRSPHQCVMENQGRGADVS